MQFGWLPGGWPYIFLNAVLNAASDWYAISWPIVAERGDVGIDGMDALPRDLHAPNGQIFHRTVPDLVFEAGCETGPRHAAILAISLKVQRWGMPPCTAVNAAVSCLSPSANSQPVSAYSIPRGQWTTCLSYMGVPAESIHRFGFGRPGTGHVAGVTSAADVFAHAHRKKIDRSDSVPHRHATMDIRDRGLGRPIAR
jgi:hypothetical protein